MAPPDTPRIEPLFGADEIAARVDGLASEIARAMPGDVLLVDDILESRRTVHAARQMLLERGANSVKICMLLDKPSKRKVACDADFCGFVVAAGSVVGYGLDDAHYSRDLPYFGAVETNREGEDTP